jgi:hypothetical protein
MRSCIYPWATFERVDLPALQKDRFFFKKLPDVGGAKRR